MSSAYPKGEPQKVIETMTRVAIEAEPRNTNIRDLLEDKQVDIANAFAKLARGNEDGTPEAESYKLFDEANPVIDQLCLEIFDAIMADLDFTRENNDDMAVEIVQGKHE